MSSRDRASSTRSVLRQSLLLGLTLSVSVEAASAAGPSESNDGRFEPKVVREYWDVSGSLEPAVARLVSSQFEDLAALAKALPSLRRWEMYQWASLAEVMSPALFSLDVPPWEPPVCEEAAGEGSILKAAKDEATKRCEDRTHAAEVALSDAVGKVRSKIGEARATVTFDRAARQTCFLQLMGHLLADGRPALNVVVTDGIDEQCGSKSALVTSQMGLARTIIIMVPSKADSAGKGDPVRRTEEIRQRFKGVRVVWASDLDPSWEWLLLPEVPTR